ncbi:MAG: glycoside hydrolase family 24 protein [Burkholderiales bacterium]
MIAISELGRELIEKSDRGYNVIVGSTPEDPDLFHSYADHPRKLVDLGHGLYSTAAGRYQLLERYYDDYKRMLGLPDFSPESQDEIATQQIRERHALPLIALGHIKAAIALCSNIWASLPGNCYGQHENRASILIADYKSAGGICHD